jgi:DNA-binding MarR family transcriptional regulator
VRQRSKPKARRLSHADYAALARLRQALRRFTSFSAAAAHAAGLPTQQHQALLAIKGYPRGKAMTVGALAEQLLITPHAATELVDRLVDSGLISRSKDAKDRRRLKLALTRKAERVLHSLSLVHLKEIRETLPALLEILNSLERA